MDMQKPSTLLTTILIALTILLQITSGQENAQLKIPRSLEECYRQPELRERDNNLPMTITTLIDLIRKIENAPGLNQDMRQIAVSLLHRFRQDGIIRAAGVATTPDILPYSPVDFQFTKHKILLSRLIPGDARNFPNNTLSSIERCTLHFMLSSSIDRQVRGDEAQRCNQLAQFRAQRIPRSIDGGSKTHSSSSGKSNFLGDVEFLETLNAKVQAKPSGKLSMDGEPFPETVDDGAQHQQHDDGGSIVDDYDSEHHFGSDMGMVEVANGAVSQCPVESGVISTPWGAVSAGTLIAGIAAGLQPQRVKLRTLFALSRRPGLPNQVQDKFEVDNKWAATLAGDLAEAALLQAPNDIRVGGSGAWNSTTEPRWYFLTQRERLEMTDAEIRGGLDGLIIATKIDEWKSKAPNMKLSQLLEMYYSQRGVLDSGIRACDRRLQFTNIAPPEELKAHAFSFASVLDRDMQLRITLYPEAIKKFSAQAVESLIVYIPQSLNDLSCEATSATPNDPTIWKTATDLYVYLDTTWPYREISATLSRIWQNIDMSPYESRVTLLNANDCKLMVNTTSSPSDLGSLWNITSHSTYPPGLNLPNILKSIQNLTQAKMEQEKAQSSSGGRSLIALIVVQNAGVSEADANFANERVQYLREQVPDVRLLFMASGAVNRFAAFVKEESKDLFTATIGSGNTATQANAVLKRIREIPRRIINPRCGPSFPEGSDSGQHQMTQYATPGAVNYYRLHPNYFYKEGSNRKLRVQGKGGPALTVCSSRQIELPRQQGSSSGGSVNSTIPTTPSSQSQSSGGDVNCRQIISETFEIDLEKPCADHPMIHKCPPLHISVEAKKGAGASSQIRCQEVECVYPDQIPFVIQSENLGCYSGTVRIFGSLLIILSLLFALPLIH